MFVILLEQALKQLPREKIQIATKFGILKTESGVEIKGSPEYVRSCCEASLNTSISIISTEWTNLHL